MHFDRRVLEHDFIDHCFTTDPQTNIMRSMTILYLAKRPRSIGMERTWCSGLVDDDNGDDSDYM